MFPPDNPWNQRVDSLAVHPRSADYVASMKMLYDVPVRVVHGGHFPSFDGERYRALIKAWLDAKGV